MFIIYLLSGYYYLLQGNESQVPLGGVIQYVTTDFVQAQLILNALISALPPPPPPPPAYQLYVTLLKQTGVDNPVATILQNTLNAADWVRAAAGSYNKLIVLGADVVSKVYIHGFSQWFVLTTPVMPIFNGAIIIGYYTLCPYLDGMDTRVNLYCTDTLFVATEMSTLFGTGENFYLPEIRVYP